MTPPRKKNRFPWRGAERGCGGNLKPTDISQKNSVYLLMKSFSLQIINRFKVGFALGWSYYGREEEYDYWELQLYVGFIGFTFQYGKIWK